MVAGEGVDFADLFAEDGVLAYPFGLPGHPAELRGRDAIRAFFADRGRARDMFVMDGVEALIRETDDPRSAPPPDRARPNGRLTVVSCGASHGGV